MVRVCEDTLPAKGKTHAGFYMEDVLKANIDLYVKNAMNDWDFVIIISGGGQVRVGKSLLALQIAYYWKDQMKKVHGIDVPFTIKDNIVFRGAELIKQGNHLGKNFPHSPLVFDEAGADLLGVKWQKSTTQDVKDFLRECGQYNLLTILVLPEFFDLSKGVALSRSDALIDVYVLPNKEGIWDRGFYNFYSRPSKKMLYLKGRKELNYKAHPKDFHGRFYNNYPIDEQEYRTAKQVALKERENDKVQDKYLVQRNVLFKILVENGFTHQKIVDEMKELGVSISQQAISYALTNTNHQTYNNMMYKNDDGGDDDGSS
jgi:hypothetical protein